MPSKMTFHESFGDVTVAQLRAYKAHNVSPSDHWDLEDFFGVGAHEAITAAVKHPEHQLGNGKCFSMWKVRDWMNGV